MLIFRSFEPLDADDLWELHSATMEDEEARMDGRFFRDLRDVFRNYITPGGEFLIGIVEDSLIACGGYVPHSSAAVEIKRMRVHPAHQRKGYGRALLRELEARAESRGFAVALIETTTTQLAALSLYQSCGYQRIGEARVKGFNVRRFSKKLRPYVDSK
jgi:ribosomal protein S18 acetylase RimI-like enzyme